MDTPDIQNNTAPGAVDFNSGGVQGPPQTAPASDPIADASAGLGPAAVAPASKPQVQAPAPSPASLPVTATSPNKMTHSFMARVTGGLLDALAGPGTPTYTTDANGKLIANVPARSTADKVRTIAEHALSGLAAGSQAPQQKSGLASLLTGAGAGAKAVSLEEQKKQAQSKAEARENFEQEQQSMLRRHEVARQNALTKSIYYENKKRANDMDPHFSQNESLFNAVKASPELGAHAVEMSSEQAEQAAAKDKTFFQTHMVKPLGWAPVIGPNGEDVTHTDENGDQVPAFYMRMAVIDGTKDGQIAVTPEMAADAKLYGPMARIPNAADIKAGDTYELGQLLPMMNKIDEQRKIVLDGWQKSELGWTTDKNGKEVPVETNKSLPPDFPGRTRPLTVKPMAMAAEEGKTALEKAQAFEAIGKGKEALANAHNALNGLSGGDKTMLPQYMDAVSKLPSAAQTVLRSVPPDYQLSIMKVAQGKMSVDEFTKSLRKGAPQITAAQAGTLATLLNPDWTGQLYKSVQKLQDNMTSGPGSQQQNGFNQFLGHAGEAADIISGYKTSKSPLLNKSVNWLRNEMAGDPQVGKLLTAIMPVKEEYLTMIKSGAVPSKDEEAQADRFLNPDLNIGQLLTNLNVMADQSSTRINQLNEQWKQLTGENYPNLVRQDALEAGKKLGIGDKLSKFNTGGRFPGVTQGSQSGQPQNAPANVNPNSAQPHEVIVGGKVAGYTVDGKTMTTTPPAGARPVGTVVTQ